MDFVKREDQNVIDEENYKVYLESLQKSHQIDTEYQHTAISMEQLHQAMQSSLNASTIVHNFQLPLSPRQMSTLMMKTNQISRSLNFNEIPAHLSRNLASEMDFMMHNVNEIPQSLRHEDILISQNISRNLDISLVKNLNELEMQTALAQNLSEQDLSRNVGELMPQNLSHDLGHQMDLSHHSNILSQDDRRTSLIIPDNNLIEANLVQNLAQNLAPRLVQTVLHENMKLEQGDHFPPMPLYIKSEQEDNYFYDSMSQGMDGVNGLNGQLADHAAQPSPQEQMYMYSQFTNPALNPIHNYIQNYAQAARDNPQNLVVNKQYDTAYQEDMKKTKEVKPEEPKENLRPIDNKFYQDYSAIDKNSEGSDDLSMNIKGEYVCFRCNEVLSSKRALKQHSKSCLKDGDISSKVGKFGCTQCAYRCQSPAILKIHERTHSGEKPFSCTFCDYKSGQKNNVAKHILVHMKEKPFRCQYCDYRCAQKNNLVVHERTHTGYKPFACPHCDYRTVQKPNLVKHLYLHTDQKPFSCDICSYRCVQKTNLTKHKQRHVNEREGEKIDLKTQVKPYRPRQKSVKCPQCSYKCVQKTSLDKHMKFKHGDVVWEGRDEVENLSVRRDGLEGDRGEVQT